MPDIVTRLANLTNADVAGRIDSRLQAASSKLGEVLKTPKAPRNPPVITVAEQALAAELANAESVSDAMDLPKANDSGLDMITLITILRNKVDENQMSFTAENIKLIQEQHAEAAKERIDDLREARRAAADAERSGAFGKFLGWFSAGLMILAGAALMVAGGSGTALLVAGVVMMAVMILQESGGATAVLNGIASGFEYLGCSSEVAHGIATGFVGGIAIAAAIASIPVAGPVGCISVATNISTLLVTPENLESMGLSAKDAGIVSMVSSGVLTVGSMSTGFAAAASAGTAAATTAQKSAGLCTKMANFYKEIPKIISRNIPGSVQMLCCQVGKAGCLVQLGMQGGGVYAGWRTAEHSYQSANAQANAKDRETELTQVEHKLEEEMERIKNISRSINERIEILMNILNQAYASQRRTLSV